MKVVDLHTELVGKIAKLHPLAEILEHEYGNLFKIGNPGKVRQLMWFQDYHVSNMRFIFLDERPYKRHQLHWYCLKEIGKGIKDGDYHWFTLDQLIICD